MGWLIAIIVSIPLDLFHDRFIRLYFIIGIVVLGAIAIYAWIEKEKKDSERRQQIATAQERAALSAISTTISRSTVFSSRRKIFTVGAQGERHQ